MTEAGLPEALIGDLRELARVPRLLVALDFDGTLAPEVDDPERARALPEAREAVLRLLALRSTRVALVSGRSLASLEEVSGLPDNALLIGSHGIEIRLDNPDDAFTLEPHEQERVEVLNEVLEEVVDSFDDVWLEEKPAGFALHTRLASDHNSRVAHLVALSETQAEVDDLKIREGKNVLEFSVRSTTKGEAVEHLRRYTKADAVFFAGDDVTDEDGFAALAEDPDPDRATRHLSVRVGDGDTRAQFRVADEQELVELFQALLSARSSSVPALGRSTE